MTHESDNVYARLAIKLWRRVSGDQGTKIDIVSIEIIIWDTPTRNT